jgi:pimeloyl-ACP methyl ester carboxylesterase
MEHPSVENYADAIDECISLLGFSTVDLYGQGLGAVVALELGILKPDIVTSVTLDSLPLWTEGERTVLLDQKMEFTPEIDGSHVVSAWSTVRDAALWGPSERRVREAIRWSPPPEPAALHADVIDVLRSAAYSQAVRAMLNHATRERVPHLKSRVMVFTEAQDTADREHSEVVRLLSSDPVYYHKHGESISDIASAITHFLDDPSVEGS